MFGAHYLENAGYNRAPIGKASGESNGHVTDDVMWPRKVKVPIQIYLDINISKTVEDRD